MRIAWFTPFSTHSAIGSYSQVIVEQLARMGHAVEVFAPAVEGKSQPREVSVPVHWLADLPTPEQEAALRRFDTRVYHMGNYFPYHRWIYEYSRRVPGITVLHDLVMRDFLRCYFNATHASLEPFYDLQEEYYHAPEDRAYVRTLRRGEAMESLEDAGRLRCPMFEPLIARSLGVIVHSEFARKRVEAVSPLPVEMLDFPRDPHFGELEWVERAAHRPIRMLSFGHLNINKMTHTVIEMLAESPELAGGIEYTVIGDAEPAYMAYLNDLVRRLGLQKRVILAGWRSDNYLKSRLLRSDFVLNLRNPHVGESSWSLQIALLAGLPCLVWDHGYYSEFPDGCVMKVASHAALRQTLLGLARRPDRLAEMSRCAFEHGRERFRTERYCERFLVHAERVAAGETYWSLAGRAARLLGELGCSGKEPWLANVASALTRLRPAA